MWDKVVWKEYTESYLGEIMAIIILCTQKGCDF